MSQTLGNADLGSLDILDLKTDYKIYQLYKLGSEKNRRESSLWGNKTGF